MKVVSTYCAGGRPGPVVPVDPCRQTLLYYEGPVFCLFHRAKKQTRIHPLELEATDVYILRCHEREPLIHLTLRGKKL